MTRNEMSLPRNDCWKVRLEDRDALAKSSVLVAKPEEQSIITGAKCDNLFGSAVSASR